MLLATSAILAAANSEGGDTGGGAAPEVPMTDIKIRINGVPNIAYKQPATVEAYDTLAKTPGRCLADACQKHLFHSSYSDIRAGITKALIAGGHGSPKLTIGKVEVVETFDGEGADAKSTGYESIDGKKKFKSDADVKVEPDKAFFDRVCAEKGVEAGSFTELIQTVANENPFDPSRKTRSAGPRKVAKAYIEAAEGLFEAGDEAVQNAVGQLSELLDRPIDVSDAETRVMELATAIADNELREKREREAALKNKYASGKF